MRILQIIDSLEAGGAEKVAVNYANSLLLSTGFSALTATRKEGSLKNQLDKKVAYFFLNKKGKLDFKAILRLRTFCKQHQIEWIHAHGSSFFTAVLLKLVLPDIKLIWHDHYGMSEFLASRNTGILKICSLFFSGIITVNTILQQWAQKELWCKNVIYLPNYTTFTKKTVAGSSLQGETGKRILCLANLRPQKNHYLLMKVANIIRQRFPDWTFHLVGKDFEDDYSKSIRDLIRSEKLDKHVFVYGSRNDTEFVIQQCDIAILTSKSEGLPIALLEYGLHQKPVVVTDVGEIPQIIQNAVNGFLVPSEEPELFADALSKLINDEILRTNLGNALHKTIGENNSETAVITQYLLWIKKKI